MATNDGFQPYPIGLSAKQSVDGIKNGYMLPTILEGYAPVINSIEPPKNDQVHNQATYWYCEKNYKLYRAMKNDNDNIVIWMEV